VRGSRVNRRGEGKKGRELKGVNKYENTVGLKGVATVEKRSAQKSGRSGSAIVTAAFGHRVRHQHTSNDRRNVVGESLSEGGAFRGKNRKERGKA